MQLIVNTAKVLSTVSLFGLHTECTNFTYIVWQLYLDYDIFSHKAIYNVHA